MKPLPLKNVMHKLRVIISDNGYRLENAAGFATYDRYGVRAEVHGIPEYFPDNLCIEDRQAQPAETSCINETSVRLVVNDAIQDALKPGGLLHFRK
ncbi:hypothetical protein [Atlantibacter subterraneus]|uniref:hypothetical protein n=1 Tax=Atlantibacter subterraneus TaxID=255519 RepID=UPI00124E6247|nr:hypothetical protein [Atlantibacter subterranea]MDW2745133.1 hypothetical protein [Atlantibacter subterranea]QFH70945.1 hypothetical protein FR762_14980 [Enterobacter sp. E76]